VRLTPAELAALSAVSAVICTFAAVVGLIAFATKSVATTLVVSAIAVAVLALGTVGAIRGRSQLARKLHVPAYLLAIGVAAVIAAGFGAYSLRGSAEQFTGSQADPAAGQGPGNKAGTASSGPVTPASPVMAAPAPPAIPKDVTTELNSSTQSSELSGIEALKNLMKTSPSDQPAAITDLASFIRSRSPLEDDGNNDQQVTDAIRAALNVLRSRNAANDGGAVINFTNTNLTDANLSGINLSGAILISADFTTDNLDAADLSGANLSYAYVGGASLTGTNLANTVLTGASFPQTPMRNGSKPVHPAEGFHCTE
jgi:hypothetical protein